VFQGSVDSSWKTKPTDRSGAVTLRSPITISPRVGICMPATSDKRVDLPQPLGPTMETKLPASMFSSIFRIASSGRPSGPSGNVTPTSLMWTSAASLIRASSPDGRTRSRPEIGAPRSEVCSSFFGEVGLVQHRGPIHGLLDLTGRNHHVGKSLQRLRVHLQRISHL